MIVALHGFTASPAMWKSIGLQGPTLLGHGPDARATGNETFAQEVERLTTFLPQEPVHLVGYSLGARLSLAIALRHPERIRRLSLIGVQPGLESESERTERVAGDRRWSKLLRDKGVSAFVDQWQALPLWSSQSALPEPVREHLRELRLGHDSEQLALSLDILGTGRMPPMWEALGTLRMPVQVIAGELDSKYKRIADRMCTLLPDASLRIIPGAGHNPVLERPQAVAELL